MPRGQVRDPAMLRMIDSDGVSTPLQLRVLDRWPDGSVRWLLCDWQATVENSGTYRLQLADVRISTEVVPPAGPQSEATIRGYLSGFGSFLDSDGIRLVADGREYRAMPDFDWFVEDLGSVRVSVLERGTLTHNGVNLARYSLRQHHFANHAAVRVHLTISNPNRAEHPGGLWDLGDAGSITIQDASVRIPLSEKEGTQGRVSPERGKPFENFSASMELYQDSSGGENWQSTNHLSRARKVPNTFRGYRWRVDGREHAGLRATPIVALRQGEIDLSVSVPQFWHNFPKGIEADHAGITLRLFPKQYAEPHELQGGEQKEHVFFVAFGKDSVTSEPLEWTRDPLIPLVDPKWVASTEAIPYFTTRLASGTYQDLVNLAIDGSDCFESKREVIDEYGWRHFGDLYGDHEAVLHTEFGPKPRISHYNNQYDAIAGFAIHWLRSGDTRWFHSMKELAFHVRDIDIYNTDEDKAAYNHGLFWHTYHYVDADTGTHRSYPKSGQIPPHGKPVPGGGPGSEQNYAHGLMLHYFLTGDEASHEAAVGLARWVIDMDDGHKTVFRWLSTADTGLASASRSPDYHGPGRGAANSLATLLDGHRLTGDRVFLNKAEQLVRRVIHPEDDVTRMVGMMRDGRIYIDVENRWFYVMFLQSLGKYLDHKVDLGEIDVEYAHARACLLHYARWMAEHEYPYLDRPEILEYPTETWAAQDMWKSEVFDFAALHAEGADRPRFRERAEFFFRASSEQLSAMPTRSLCRPVVLMLSHGWRRAWFADNADERRPRPTKLPSKFEPRAPFVPQKTLAMKRAKICVVVGGGLLTAIIALIVWWLV